MDKNVLSRNGLVILDSNLTKSMLTECILWLKFVVSMTDLTKYLANLAAKWHVCFD
jgi:hypothetical protein